MISSPFKSNIMAGRSFTAKQVLFTFRDSKSGSSKIFITGSEMYSVTNHVFDGVVAGTISDVIFQEKGNQLTAQTAGQTDLMAFNVEDVIYTGRQEKIVSIANKKLDLEEKKIDKAIKDLDM